MNPEEKARFKYLQSLAPRKGEGGGIENFYRYITQTPPGENERIDENITFMKAIQDGKYDPEDLRAELKKRHTP